MGMVEPKTRAVSKTNTGSIPLPPLLTDSSTDLPRAGLSCRRKSVVRNQCMVSCRADVETAADAAASVEEDPSLEEEEEPFLAINPDDRRNEDSDDKTEDGGAGIKLATALVVSMVLE